MTLLFVFFRLKALQKIFERNIFKKCICKKKKSNQNELIMENPSMHFIFIMSLKFRVTEFKRNSV